MDNSTLITTRSEQRIERSFERLGQILTGERSIENHLTILSCGTPGGGDLVMKIYKLTHLFPKAVKNTGKPILPWESTVFIWMVTP